MSATLSPPLFFQQFNPNNSGAPAIGFKLYTYEAGTNTKQPTWTDSTQGTENANPLTLDANGGANVWGDPTTPYKLVWAPANDTDPPTSPIRTVDNVNFPLTLAQITQSLVGGLLYPRTAAEIEAGVTPANFIYPPGDVRRYGADSSGAADSGPAFNSAYAVAVALGNTIGGVIRVPAGVYKITTPVVFSSTTTGYLAMIGDGPGTKIVNNVTGNPANPCILVQAKAPYFLFANFDIFGNSTTGAGGNGHGIAFINPDGVGTAGVTSFYPQSVTLLNVSVQFHEGTGKDYAGAAIPACGVYEYGITVHEHIGCAYFSNQMGVRTYICEKVHLSHCTIDGNNIGVNGLYIDSTLDLKFIDGTLNGCGQGGATDGCVYVVGTNQVSNSIGISKSRIKNGNPFLVNLSGAAFCNNRAVTISDCDLRQLSDPGSHALTAISVGNGNQGVKISGNYFVFVNTITAGVGIDVVQETAGYNCGGLEISGNVFDMGVGGTYLACVRFNVGANKVLSPIVRANTFGNTANAFTITDGIRLAGNVQNPRLENNYFIPANTGVITNCINLISGNVNYPTIEGNSYDTSAGGTITNQIANAGPALGASRNENGLLALGDVAFAAALATSGTISTATPFSRVAPAAAVTGVILQPGTFRGQMCFVENNSGALGNTITFAAAGTSNVADGATAVIPGLAGRLFVWDASTSLWYRAA